MSRRLTAFIVPGPDVARSFGLDVEGAGLRTVDTPRHASVLFLVGELPEGLREAAAVAYAQMMRPRAILAVGSENTTPLPEPDVSVALNIDSLAGGVEELRRAFANAAFGPEAEDFEAEVVQEDEQDEGEMDHGHDHGGHEEESDEEDQESDSEDEDDGSEEKEIGEDQLENFMSMIEMTEGMPESGDGLIMEWVPAPYGPLFPGLPGGLSLTFTLDGDTVAKTEVEPGIRGHSPVETLQGPVGSLTERAAKLDPLSPVAYRLLAQRAIEDAAGKQTSDEEALSRVGALERERAASHLGWAANFGFLIGDKSLSQRAAHLQLALLRAENVEEIGRIRGDVEDFVRKSLRTPLLGSKLGGIGTLDGVAAEDLAGPVARAAGSEKDARSEEPAYRSLSFTPLVREDNDVLARFRLRLEEIKQSLGLVLEAGAIEDMGSLPDNALSGTGTATIETPRGTARLDVTLEDVTVTAAELDSPSMHNVWLVEVVTVGKEVADALVGVGSLDLSPWEMSRVTTAIVILAFARRDLRGRRARRLGDRRAFPACGSGPGRRGDAGAGVGGYPELGQDLLRGRAGATPDLRPPRRRRAAAGAGPDSYGPGNGRALRERGARLRDGGAGDGRLGAGRGIRDGRRLAFPRSARRLLYAHRHAANGGSRCGPSRSSPLRS